MINFSNRHVRLLLAVSIMVLLLIAMAAGLFISEALLRVWAELRQKPAWITWFFAGIVAIPVLISAWLVWRLLLPAKKSSKPEQALNERGLREHLQNAAKQGIDTHRAEQELAELERRRGQQALYIAVFGTISSGKSSLIQALLPDAILRTGVQGGTTTQVSHYDWLAPSGDRVVLADVPGSHGVAGLDTTADSEAMRAHIVLYVCDGDLNRDQFQALQTLLRQHKPTLVAFNKTDRYSTDELALIRERLVERLQTASVDIDVVTIRAGGSQEIIRLDAQGRQHTEILDREPHLDNLHGALHKLMARPDLMHLRDHAIFHLADQKLQHAVMAHHNKEADQIVISYTRRAVVGALAAVSPGTDIVIQGYLGISMVKALCTNYAVDVREVEIEDFLKSAQGRMGKTIPMVLAIAGNGLKAFPGIGTIAGGLVHAVAYGLIFDTLGKSLVKALQNRAPAAQTRFPANPAVNHFQEMLHGDLESAARRIIAVAMAQKNRTDNEQA